MIKSSHVIVAIKIIRISTSITPLYKQTTDFLVLISHWHNSKIFNILLKEIEISKPYCASNGKICQKSCI